MWTLFGGPSNNGGESPVKGLIVDRELACDNVVEQLSHAKNIGWGFSELCPFPSLGSCIEERTNSLQGRSKSGGRALSLSGESEIRNCPGIRLQSKDVGWLDIAVEDSLLVYVRKSSKNLPHEMNNVVIFAHEAVCFVCKTALSQGHCVPKGTLCIFARFKYRHDIGVPAVSNESKLPFKASADFNVSEIA
jgi:hypothetical protein